MNNCCKSLKENIINIRFCEHEMCKNCINSNKFEKIDIEFDYGIEYVSARYSVIKK